MLANPNRPIHSGSIAERQSTLIAWCVLAYREGKGNCMVFVSRAGPFYHARDAVTFADKNVTILSLQRSATAPHILGQMTCIDILARDKYLQQQYFEKTMCSVPLNNRVPHAWPSRDCRLTSPTPQFYSNRNLRDLPKPKRTVSLWLSLAPFPSRWQDTHQ